jgi:hypothetical protein
MPRRDHGTIITRKMNDLNEKFPLTQLALAVLLAFGMVLTMVYPLSGKFVGLISGGLIILLYLFMGIRLLMARDNKSFEVILYIINYFGSAVAVALIAAAVISLQQEKLLALIAIAVLLICLVLNLANRYIYKIKEDNYFFNQGRVFFLALICMFLLFAHGAG